MISYLPYPIRRKWYLDLKSAILWSAATRWPVLTQDAVQLSLGVWVGLGRSIPDWLIGIAVMFLPGILDVSPWKRAMRNVSCSSSYTSWNVIPMSEVMRCKKAHSWWRDSAGPPGLLLPPHKRWPPSPATPSHSPPSTAPVLSFFQQSPQSIVSPSRTVSHIPKIRSPNLDYIFSCASIFYLMKS